MKLATIAASTILILGLSTTAYAEMGKCGGAGMGKQGMKCGAAMKGNMPFKDRKAMCLSNLDTMQKCVNAATTNDELQACKTKMMGKMQGSKGMMGKGKNMQGQGGTGKCGSK